MWSGPTPGRVPSLQVADTDDSNRGHLRMVMPRTVGTENRERFTLTTGISEGFREGVAFERRLKGQGWGSRRLFRGAGCQSTGYRRGRTKHFRKR